VAPLAPQAQETVMDQVQAFGSAVPVARQPLDAKLEFLRRTYVHLAGTMLLFLAMAWFMVTTELAGQVAALFSGGRMGMLLFLGGFMLAGWLASRMAHSVSIGVQYAGLVLYAAFYAFFFSPILWYAATAPGYEGVLGQAAALTIVTFGGLTAYVFMTKKDFSFLGPALVVVSLVAVGCIVGSVIFGFSLGIWFSGLMILFACGAILYDTSKILLHYGRHQYVGAAVELFASVMILFFYILRLLMQLRR